METGQELPTWAARTHQPGSNLLANEPIAPEPPRRRRGLRTLMFVLLGVLALAGMAALGYLAATLTTDDDSTVASESGEGAESSPTTDAADGDSTTGTGADADGTDAETTDADSQVATSTDGDDADADAADPAEETADETADDPEADDPEADTGEVVDNSDGSVRYAVLEGGQLFLRGRVPDAEMSGQIEAVATQVLGPGNVINEYEVDPTTPEVAGGPVYVADVVLFEFNSIEIAPPFLPILDLGTTLMQVSPTATITIVARTDSVGSEEVNLRVAEQRAQAVANYWISQGVDPSRIIIDARGEEEASEDEDTDDAARNRRVEFVIQDLLG